MERVCFLLRVKKELIDDYRCTHQSVNPDMLKALSDSGIRNYSLFLHPDGLLVGYFEAENPKESLRKLGETEANRRWQELMSPYFESGSGDMEKGELEWLEQIFYLE